MNKKNIIFIGMPGAGKSTLGVVLAKAIGYHFIDSDIVIQEKTGKLLSEIIAEAGNEGFNKIENDINMTISPNMPSIISTGGSAIYGEGAMKHFSEIGIILYIKLSYEEIEKRVGDVKERGISIPEGKTLKDLYNDRIPLYEKYANITIENDNNSIRESIALIRKKLAL